MWAEYMTSSMLLAVSKNIRRIKSSLYSSSICIHTYTLHTHIYICMCTYNIYTHTVYERNLLCCLRTQYLLFWNVLTEINPQGPISWLFYSFSWLKRQGLFIYFGLNLKSELKGFYKKNKSTFLYRTKTEAENGCAIYIHRKITVLLLLTCQDWNSPRISFNPEQLLLAAAPARGECWKVHSPEKIDAFLSFSSAERGIGLLTPAGAFQGHLPLTFLNSENSAATAFSPHPWVLC